MASTYTVNLGIEKIGTGEQSGTWGNTTNTNFDLIDQAVNGAVTVTLASAGTSGSPNTLAITDGASSDGRNKFIEFADGADLGATAYIQLTPNDAEKIVHMRNSLSGGRSVIVFQGTYNASNDFEIPNGKDVVLKFDGGGATATVTQVFEDLLVTAVAATTVDTTNIEVTNLKAKDGTSAGSIADSTGVVTLASSVLTTTDINGGSVDGVTLGTNSAVTEAQIDNININGNTISSTDTNGNVTITPDGTGSVAITKIDVAGGEIDGTAIGGNSASTAVFTNLTASGTVSFSGATVSNGGTVTTVNIDGGSIDGTIIGAASPAAGSFTTVGTSSNVTVGGTLDVSGLSSFSAVEATGNVTTTSSGGLRLKIGKIAGVPSDATDAFVAIQDSGGPGSLAGDLILIPRSSNTLDNAIRLFSGYTTPAERFAVAYGEAAFNDPGNDYDFRVESDTNTHMLFMDAVNNRVNIGTTDVSSQGTLAVNGSAIFGRSATTTGDFFSSGGGNNGTYNGVAIMSNSDQINAQANTALSSWIVDIGGRAADGVTFPVATADSFSVRRVAAGGAYLSAANYLQISSSGTVFNEDGADHDFRVESDTDTHAFFVDAGNNAIGLLSGSSPEANSVSVEADLIVGRASNTPNFSHNFAGGGYKLSRSGTGPKFFARSGGAADDVTVLYINNEVAWNTVDIRGGMIVNETGIDSDFRVESDTNTHALFVDAGAVTGGRIGIKTSTPDHSLTVQGAASIYMDAAPFYNIKAVDYSTTDTGVFIGSVIGGVYQGIGTAYYYNSGYFRAQQADATALNFFDGKFTFYANTVTVDTNYLPTTIAQIGPLGTVFNENGADTDFRVESDTNTHALFVDAGNNRVNIGGSSISDGDLNVNDMIRISGAAPELRIDVGSAGYYLQLTEEYNFPKSIGHIRSVANTSYDGQLQFSANQGGGAFRELARMDYADGTVFNETSVDLDFRVESDNNTHALFVDASANSVSIGTSTAGPSSGLYINGATNPNGGIVGTNQISGFVASNYTGTRYWILHKIQDSGTTQSTAFNCIGYVHAASYTTWNVSEMVIRREYASTTISATITGKIKSGVTVSVVDINLSSDGNRYLAIKFAGGDPGIEANLVGYLLNTEYTNNGSTARFETSGVTENAVIATY